MEAAASGAVSTGLGRILDPLTRPIGFCMERMLINNLIEPMQAAQLIHKGLNVPGGISFIGESYGYDSAGTQALLDVTREPAGFMDTLLLLNRGYIDEGTAYNWIRLNGLDDDIAQPLINLRWHVPNVGDVQSYIAGLGYSQDRIDQFGLEDEYPQDANQWLQKNGATDEVGKKAWIAHWSMPQNGILLDAYHRRIISKDELYAGMAVNGVPPVMRSVLEQQGVTLPMRRQINMMFKYGVIDQNYANDIYLRYGFSEDDANRLTALTVKSVNPYEAGNLASDATTAYEDDLVDYDTAKTWLMQAGHSEWEAGLHLLGSTHKKGAAVLKTVESYVHDAYINGDLTLDEAVNQVLQYGEMSERAKVLRELWTEEKIHTIKHVSESDSRSGYRLGLINSSQLRTNLEMLHYDEDSISVIIALENATMQKPQANVIAPITTSSGKAKSFTKAELKKMYIDGIIDSNTWYDEMLSLGYTDAQVAAYAQLMIAGTSTTGGSTSAAT